MTTDLLMLEAQAALEELKRERLLPFNLQAHVLDTDGAGHYTLRFYDSRLHSVMVELEEGQSFKEAIRVTVLERVARLTGPLRKPKG